MRVGSAVCPIMPWFYIFSVISTLYFIFAILSYSLATEMYIIIRIVNSGFDTEGTLQKKFHLTPKAVLCFIPPGRPLRCHCISLKIMMPENIILISKKKLFD